MFGWLTSILQAFLDAEIDLRNVTEIEFGQGDVPWTWYLHFEPEQPWFAGVSCHEDEWGIVLYSYIVGE